MGKAKRKSNSMEDDIQYQSGSDVEVALPWTAKRAKQELR